MATCFIFVKYINDEGCLSVTLNQQGDMEAPLAQRSFSEIKQMQTNTTTIAVVSTEHFSLHRLELPWLAEKKARAAIPYALEGKLAENVEDLHFAFDRNHYQHDHYLIAVCNKSWLIELIATLDNYNLHFDSLTLDWFALANNEACVMDTNVLVHDNLIFCGSLAPELALIYLQNVPAEKTIYTFVTNNSEPVTGSVQAIEMDSSLWIAKRLQAHKYMNVSQGALRHGNSHAKTQRWYWAAAAMSLVWLISILLNNGIKIHTLNAQTKDIDSQIASSYRYYFPNAQQIISPRFRIGQLLKSRKNDNDTAFWILLNQLTQASQHIQSTVEQFRFQNRILQVTVISKDFDALEALQTFLQKAAITVKQTQASSRDDKVIGTLELSL